LTHYLKKVATPALIVWGRQDAIVPLECGELYQQALGNATLKVIDNCGHAPQFEKPQEFQAAVGEFLGGLK
jgi:pimeloyl-ACP methyl ester carboxylesterase